METKKIGIIVGSLRKGSFCKQIANNVMNLAPQTFKMEEIEIGALEMFNQDFDDEGNTPASWTSFREKVKQYDGFVFITPEYNRSIPPVLKNALDIASRPYGQNLWNAKPGAVISVSPGAIGGFGANHHLRQTLSFLNVSTMAQPEAYIGNVMSIIDENGDVNQSTGEFLKMFVDSFEKWVQVHS